MAKSYALSKTKVREMITEKFGKDLEVAVSIGAVLALFEGKSVGSSEGSVLVMDGEEVVGKRCSYFGKFMPISEFGKRGEKYAYQCKLAESLVRKQRTEAIQEKAVIDERLANEEIPVSEWKEQLAALDAAKSEKVALPDDAIVYDTAEDLLASIA